MQQQSISAVVTHGDVKQSQLADSKSASPASLPDYHYFKLISQDKTTFPIERDNLRISKFFTDLFVENPKVSEFKMDSPSHVVGYLVEYLNQHKGFFILYIDSFYSIYVHSGKPGSGINVQKPIRSQNLCDSGISEWDNDFAKRLWNLSNESFMV